MVFGRIIFRKNVNWQICFWENHGKLAHLRNLAPKIIYAYNIICMNVVDETSL
jgi:hypothetical protein